MDLWETCREKKEALGMTIQDLADASGLPAATIKKFFSGASKSPSIYTVAPICRVLGISLDAVFEITDHYTATEKTLQAEKDGLEHRLDNKKETIEILQKSLAFRRHVIYNLLIAVALLVIVVVLLLAWCVYIDYHCADYGLWRG